MKWVYTRCMTQAALASKSSPKRFTSFGRPLNYYDHTPYLCNSPENELRSLAGEKSQVGQASTPTFPYLPYSRLSDSLEEKRQPERVHTCLSLRQHIQSLEPRAQPYEKGSLRWFPAMVVSPAVQIFSVEIHPNSENEDNVERPCEVHGSIRVNEARGRTFSLFKREPADPAMIFNQGNLPLNDTYGSLITCSVGASTKLDLNLKDKARGIEIVHGQHVLHSKAQEIEDSCDKLIKAFIQGQHGYAIVCYTIFKLAVVANVTIEISKKHDVSCQNLDVYGSVVALYPNSRKYCNSEGDLKYMKTTLFSKHFDNPLRTKVGDPIGLSRCVIVVPAYASLKIEADLWDIHGPFAQGSVECIALGRGTDFESIEGEGGIISVSVTWKETFSRLYEDRVSRTYPNIGCTEEISTSKGGNTQEKPLNSREQQVGTGTFDPFGSEYTSRSVSSVPGIGLVEVFSIYVDGIIDKLSAVCGVIQFCDGPTVHTFERDLSNPELLSAQKSNISLDVHSSFEAVLISIHLRLNDPVSGLEVCHGEVSWCPVSSSSEPCYTRLCAIVRGQHGYAVVHYMILDEACLAKLEITLFFDNMFVADIHGSISARYSNYDYSSEYQKKYYQSRLFDKRQGESIQLKTHSKIPLQKSVVAVDTNSALIVEADLRAVCDGHLEDEALRGSTMFEIELSKTSRKKIRGAHYYIEVAVYFRNDF